MTTITLGHHAKTSIELDLNTLVRTRLLVQANSGVGPIRASDSLFE